VVGLARCTWYRMLRVDSLRALMRWLVYQVLYRLGRREKWSPPSLLSFSHPLSQPAAVASSNAARQASNDDVRGAWLVVGDGGVGLSLSDRQVVV
jgi:hypothetical protein